MNVSKHTGNPTRRHPAHTGRATGFTLIELVVVLFIATILAAVAVPRYASATRRYQLDSAAHRLAADLMLAQEAARATSKQHEVYFDFSGHSYFLYGIQDMDNGYVDTWVQLAEPPYRVELFKAFGKDINDSGTSLYFNGFGLPDQGGSITLRKDGELRVVTVDADTGKAEIQ